MKKLFVLMLVAGLASCDNNGTTINLDLDSAKMELDTLANKIENSETLDSIGAKGGEVLDSVKSKGGRLVNRLDVKINTRDSVK